MNEIPKLALVPTDDLIEELRGRFEATVILLLQTTSTDPIKGSEDMQVAWSGGRYTAIGMASDFAHDALNRGRRVEGSDPR